MKGFTDVQTLAFSENETDYNEWFDWVHQVNQQAMLQPNHYFWLLWTKNEKAASCVITIQTGDLIGIYGVGILLEYRRLGYNSVLLQYIFEDAHYRKIPLSTLQVIVGSYTEILYTKLGFETAFVLDVLHHGQS